MLFGGHLQRYVFRHRCLKDFGILEILALKEVASGCFAFSEEKEENRTDFIPRVI